MKPTSIIQRLVILLITLMSAIGANADEAYACYTSSNTTLTFYYDNQRNSRPGTTYDLNSGSTDPLWLSSNVTKVVFNSSFSGARPTSTYSWFYNMTNLQSITGLSYLNTSMVTNMAWMFGYCSSLTSLDLSSFNTAKVTDMDYMFNGCTSLQTIYAGSGWITNTVSSSTAMFSDCTSLVGGKRTNYDKNHVDKTYAHIDGGSNNPGYFTALGTLAYACYTEENNTLTFYYDNERSSREGTTYDLNTGNVEPGWYKDGTYENVIEVEFDSSFAGARPTTTFSWFYGMTNLFSIKGMSYLNTSQVTDMRWMFYNCSILKSLNLCHFDTSKVDYMARMFSGCSSLTTLDLSSFDTSLVDEMGNMFSECRILETIYVGSGWQTDGVISSGGMFYHCTNLVGGQGTEYNYTHTDKTYAHIDGGPDNPGYLTDTYSLRTYACYTPSNTTLTFYYDKLCNSRPGTTYDLNRGSSNPGWRYDETRYNVTKVEFDSSFAGARPTTTYDWFYGMTSLQSIEDMKYLNTSEVTDMSYMFRGCNNLTSLDLSHFNTSKVTDMGSMFYECSKLTRLDLSHFNTSKVTDMTYMFSFCFNLQTIYVGDGWSTTAVKKSYHMFTYAEELVGGQGTAYDVSHLDKTYARIDEGTSNPGYFTRIGAAPWTSYACYTPENKKLTFYYDNLRYTRSGRTYDLNKGSTETGWESDGTNEDVTKVEFDSSFAGARPTTTYDWFYGMENLASITGIKYLNTSEVTSMSWMFYNCSKLTSLDLRHFDTSKVDYMVNMFAGCESLESLDLSNFNTSDVTNMQGMFNSCSNLQTIYVGDGWSTAAVKYSDEMFLGCSSLKGGKGTKYNANYVDATYARIDEGTSNPGYFTYKKPSGITTGIENGQRDSVKGQSSKFFAEQSGRAERKVQSEEWYTIDGRKLSGEPTKRGVYIHNGKAVVK